MKTKIHANNVFIFVKNIVSSRFLIHVGYQLAIQVLPNIIFDFP
jgi:hypothetical protein